MKKKMKKLISNMSAALTSYSKRRDKRSDVSVMSLLEYEKELMLRPCYSHNYNELFYGLVYTITARCKKTSLNSL